MLDELTSWTGRPAGFIWRRSAWTTATNVETDLIQLLERTARRELAATRAWRVEAAAGSLRWTRSDWRWRSTCSRTRSI